MSKMKLLAVLAAGFMMTTGIAKADLLTSTINADIVLTGSDDHGSYTITLVNGAINVGSGFSTNYNFSKQLTEGGFSTASNVLSGTVGLAITANQITVTFNGQAQPVELMASFTNLPGTITGATESDSGFLSGVSMPLSNSFAATSLDVSAFYLGYQPGTSTSQVNTLTFQGSVDPPPAATPEPSSIALLGTGLLGVVGAAKRRLV